MTMPPLSSRWTLAWKVAKYVLIERVELAMKVMYVVYICCDTSSLAVCLHKFLKDKISTLQVST